MRILLVRADGIGDALACAPLVAALHAAGHRVSAVLGRANHGAFAERAFARVHVLDRIPWPRHGATRESLREVRAGVLAERYDAALIASEEPLAYAIASDAAIAARVGFVNGWEKPFKTLVVRPRLTRALVRAASAARACEHEVETLFRLGADFVREREPTRDVARLRELVLDDAPAPQRFVAVQVSGKLSRTGLDAAAYAALGRELAARGRPVRVFGDDRELVASVARACGGRAYLSLSVAAWKAHLAAARVVVTPDSGAAHVAGMVGVPCVDCFAPRPATVRDVARWRPWAAPYRALVVDPARERGALATVLANAVDELAAERP